MSTQYIAKGQAMAEIMQNTGFGRQIVEKKMVELEAKGLIRFIDDPADTRRKLISREHIQVVIEALTPK